MHSLNNKHIILGVTGGIAAYKSAELIRRLIEMGAEVRVVMTKAATEFITPLTLQALSGNPVHQTMLDPEAEAAMGHVELARWADLVLIAPASADFMARLAMGQGDDLLTTLCLASKAKIALAPAMNQAMWLNASTQDNVKLLLSRQVSLCGPADGSQACGDIGPGRMTEPTEIALFASSLFESGILAGKNVVITAGPTREAIDPVRYISNHSSGKMGYALAEAAIAAGASVTLISGPVNLSTPKNVKRLDVISADDMFNEVMAAIQGADIFIAAAAVADYKPLTYHDQKLKKGEGDELTIALTKNRDIVAAVAKITDKPFTVGFAAETQHMIEHAKDKLKRKRLDLIIANNVANTAIGFNSDDNAVTVISASSEVEILQCSKKQLSIMLIEEIAIKSSKTL